MLASYLRAYIPAYRLWHPFAIDIPLVSQQHYPTSTCSVYRRFECFAQCVYNLHPKKTFRMTSYHYFSISIESIFLRRTGCFEWLFLILLCRSQLFISYFCFALLSSFHFLGWHFGSFRPSEATVLSRDIATQSVHTQNQPYKISPTGHFLFSFLILL